MNNLQRLPNRCEEEDIRKNERRILQFHRVFRGYETAVNRCFEEVLAVIGPPEPGVLAHCGAICRRL